MNEKTFSKVIAENRKARFEYFIEDVLECGMVLLGSEVKSLKSGGISFADAYAKIEKGEVFLIGLHIPVYPFATLHNHEPNRVRKLLLNRSEITKLKRKTDEKGYTLVPVRIVNKEGKIKCELGLGKGKKNYDKRETIKKRDLERDMSR
jgi:SsrA-binding protein